MDPIEIGKWAFALGGLAFAFIMLVLAAAVVSGFIQTLREQRAERKAGEAGWPEVETLFTGGAE